MLTGIVNGYKIRIIWSDEDECYIARALKLEGCVTHGDSLAEAVKNVGEAIESWLECARKHGDPIPSFG